MRPVTSLLFFLILLLTAVAALAKQRTPPFLIGSRENVVILGDSITADGRYGQIMQDYIDAKFADRQIHVISAGKSGDTVRGSLTRLESDVVNWRPDWVLINLGVNDMGRFSSEEYLMNYEALLNRLTRDTKAKIGIMSFIYFDRDEYRNFKLETAYITGLQALAKKYGCLYIPCYETFKALRPSLPKGVRYAADSVHPTPFGYWIFAQSVLKGLNYPFTGKPLALDIPVTRLATLDADHSALVGQTFTLALPDPLQITITKYQPNTTTAPRAKKAMKIDGKLDEWDLSHPILLNRREQQCGGVMKWGQETRSAKAYSCYDDKAWYFAIQVDTPVVVNKPTSTGVMRDCIELHLDLRETKERQDLKAAAFLQNGAKHVVQYLISPATPEYPKPELMKGSGDAGMLDGVTWASTLTNTGYIIEVAVPAAQFPGGVITPGSTYGLDITVDDLDRFEIWSDLTQMRWSGSQYSFFNSLEFGQMTIGG